MTQLNNALAQVGVGNPVADSLGQAIDAFTAQNLSVADLSTASRAIKDAAQASLPTILRVPPTSGEINFSPVSGEWVSVHYADDLIAHAPKFKFLFKVTFIGFGQQEFQYYVHRCDKPKVLLNHTDVNFYNFRSRVLTSVTFQPLNMTLLDETGNSVNAMFVDYLSKVSQQASGGWGIDKGMDGASSTKAYEANFGYSHGQKVIIEQVFANGLYSNLFELINPRFESFDFDELNMEDSSSGSMLNVTLSFDSLRSTTVKLNDFGTWGNADLRSGGGSSGIQNAGASSAYEAGYQPQRSANGSGINGPDPIARNAQAVLDAALSYYNSEGTLPAALRGLGGGAQQIIASVKEPISSAGDVLSRNVQDTIAAVKNGFTFEL